MLHETVNNLQYLTKLAQLSLNTTHKKKLMIFDNLLQWKMILDD